MKKKCLYIRTDICEDFIAIGGSIGHSLGVINNFIDKFDVTVFFSMNSKILCLPSVVFYKLHIFPAFYLVRWRFWYLRWRLQCIFSTFSFFLQIIFYTYKQSFSFIYQRYSILNATGVLLSKYKKVPLVLEYNGSEAYWFEPRATDPWYHRWFSFKRLSYAIEAINVQHAHTIVAVSQALKDDLVARGVQAEKIIVNPNGVEENIFHGAYAMQKQNALRMQYHLEDTFVFGFIGTFGHWHGIEMLAEIIPALCDHYSQVRFFLIGDGSLRHFLEEKMASYIQKGLVILTGAIEQHKAPEYLSVCDAFLCPTRPNADGSRFFGSPTKLFEYMSMAKPVIASDLEQLTEILNPAFKVNNATDVSILQKQGVTNQIGILVPPLDAQGFVKACQLCLSLSDKERKKIGDNARNEVLQKYTWKKHVERIINHITCI